MALAENPQRSCDVEGINVRKFVRSDHDEPPEQMRADRQRAHRIEHLDGGDSLAREG
jgi:hypothetical protein